MAERYFNRQEAEELLPMIGRSLEEALKQKRSLDVLDEDLSKAAARIMMLGGSVPPYQELARKRGERQQFVASLEESVNKIQETGCVVKDLETGLVDFPSLLDGQEIYLCWKLGEKRIGYWHSMDEGFAGRKPLEGSPDDPPDNPSVQ
ncbi:MAG: DUF2203 domain-containing protein [Acidobacteriota bacterium]|nr:DUF2203 domain-containing protein [Acidobacteriota bacterium]